MAMKITHDADAQFHTQFSGYSSRSAPLPADENAGIRRYFDLQKICAAAIGRTHFWPQHTMRNLIQTMLHDREVRLEHVQGGLDRLSRRSADHTVGIRGGSQLRMADRDKHHHQRRPLHKVASNTRG